MTQRKRPDLPADLTRPELEQVAYNYWGYREHNAELRYYFRQAFRKQRTEAKQTAQQDLEARTENGRPFEWKRTAPPARRGKQ